MYTEYTILSDLKIDILEAGLVKVFFMPYGAYHGSILLFVLSYRCTDNGNCSCPIRIDFRTFLSFQNYLLHTQAYRLQGKSFDICGIHPHKRRSELK